MLGEESNEDRTLMKELDIVHRQLKQVWKENDKRTGNSSVDYYTFVINKKNFAETIENMFYVAFLIKDGYAKLYIEPLTGLPSLGLCLDPCGIFNFSFIS